MNTSMALGSTISYAAAEGSGRSAAAEDRSESSGNSRSQTSPLPRDDNTFRTLGVVTESAVNDYEDGHAGGCGVPCPTNPSTSDLLPMFDSSVTRLSFREMLELAGDSPREATHLRQSYERYLADPNANTWDDLAESMKKRGDTKKKTKKNRGSGRGHNDRRERRRKRALMKRLGGYSLPPEEVSDDEVCIVFADESTSLEFEEEPVTLDEESWQWPTSSVGGLEEGQNIRCGNDNLDFKPCDGPRDQGYPTANRGKQYRIALALLLSFVGGGISAVILLAAAGREAESSPSPLESLALWVKVTESSRPNPTPVEDQDPSGQDDALKPSSVIPATYPSSIVYDLVAYGYAYAEDTSTTGWATWPPGRRHDKDDGELSTYDADDGVTTLEECASKCQVMEAPTGTWSDKYKSCWCNFADTKKICREPCVVDGYIDFGIVPIAELPYCERSVCDVSRFYDEKYCEVDVVFDEDVCDAKKEKTRAALEHDLSSLP